MALKPLLSFSSGELDPVLTDNVTLEKFNKGLTTARNVLIGKTGSILSRFSRYHLRSAKNSGEAIKIYHPPNTSYLLEFGDLYVRVLTFGYFGYFYEQPQLALSVELVTLFTEADLPYLHFETSKDFVYIFRSGQKMRKLQLDGASSAFVADADVFKIPPPPNTINITPSGVLTGFPAYDFIVTVVINGEESEPIQDPTSYVRAGAIGESLAIDITWVGTDEVSEMRVYARPVGGGAFGFLGLSTDLVYDSGTTTWTGNYLDFGGEADFTNSNPGLITDYGLNGEEILDLDPKTGLVYQQRLLLGGLETDEEAILASRPGYQNNFQRDFPYAADSALQFKSGSSGKANVLRMLDHEGLIVFTTKGVYTNAGLLSVDNSGLDRRGAWIINETIPPLVVPGGVFFVDRANVIRQLVFSQEILAYESVEQTIFSNHLFKNRTIKSWTYQDGPISLIIVTFSDGEWASFTYNFEHQMRAWTRHDSKYPVDQVEGGSIWDYNFNDLYPATFFVTNKDGDRSIEVSLPRLPGLLSQQVDEYYMMAPNAFMDSMRTYSTRLNDLLNTDEYYTITPVVADTWDGELTLANTFAGSFPAGFVVGDIIRVFNPEDKSVIDLTVSDISGYPATIQATPSEEFPEELSEAANLYTTRNVINTGLDHLEGESVSVMVDGSLVTSPYNDQEDYEELVVTGGAITLPDDMYGAIIQVGRPIVADVKTLNVSTLEQAPTLIESLNCNKIYVRVNESRGLYISNKFPEEADGDEDGTSVDGMEDLDESLVPLDDDLIGNTYHAPVSRRIEKTLPGSWESQGKVSIRQVDPYHFEIISLIPDITVLPRSDR
jgi:hypothetical protein